MGLSSLVSEQFIRNIDDSKFLTLLTGFGVMFLIRASTQNKALSKNTNAFELATELFITYMLASLIWTQVPIDESLVKISLAIIFLLGIIHFSNLDLKTLFKNIKMIPILFGALLIGAYFLLPTKPSNIHIPLIGHYSYGSDLSVFCFAISLHQLCFAKKSYQKTLFFILSCLFLIAIMSIARRASAVTLGTMAILTVILYKKTLFELFKSYKTYICVAVFALIVVLTPPLLNKSFSNRALHTQQEFKSFEKNPRVVIYKNTLKGAKQRPLLGWGYGSFRYQYSRWTNLETDPKSTHYLFDFSKPKFLDHPHNEFLYHLFQGGIVGACLYFLIFALLIYKLSFSLKRNPTPHKKLIFILNFAILTPQLFNTSSQGPLVYLVSILVFASTFQIIKADFKERVIPKHLIVPQSILKNVVLVAALLFSIGYYLNSYFLVKSTQSQPNYEKHEKSVLNLLYNTTYDSLYFKAKAKMSLKDFNDADQNYSKLLKHYPYLPNFYYRIPFKFFLSGELQRAPKYLKQGDYYFPNYSGYKETLMQVNSNLNTESAIERTSNGN